MEAFGLDIANLLVGAVSGLAGAVLTYLATRRQHEVSERSVYLGAVEQLTGSLRAEIERLGSDRQTLGAKVATLEARIAELEARERQFLMRIEELERERDRLKRTFRGRNGEQPEGGA